MFENVPLEHLTVLFFLFYWIVLDCEEEEINRIQTPASPSQSDPYEQQG